jgi:AIR synthase related protein, N-terminal domain
MSDRDRAPSSNPVALQCPPPSRKNDLILLGHGGGGRLTAELVRSVFLPALSNPVLDRLNDSAEVSVGGNRVLFTTDSFVVSPLRFPGGDIGSLAVNGTINDLAVAGAQPLGLSAAFILEEGFPIAELRQNAVDARGVAAGRRSRHRGGYESGRARKGRRTVHHDQRNRCRSKPSGTGTRAGASGRCRAGQRSDRRSRNRRDVRARLTRVRNHGGQRLRAAARTRVADDRQRWRRPLHARPDPRRRCNYHQRTGEKLWSRNRHRGSGGASARRRPRRLRDTRPRPLVRRLRGQTGRHRG